MDDTNDLREQLLENAKEGIEEATDLKFSDDVEPEKLASENVEETPIANDPVEVGESEAVQEEQAPTIDPPHSWRADKKEAFKTLPSDVQEYIVQRESERDAYLNQKGQKYSELDRVLEKYEGEWQRSGLSSARVINQLLAWNDYLTQNPVQALNELASKAGIDLAQLAQVNQAAGPQDPYVRQLLAETQALKDERRREQEAQEASQMQALSATVEAFGSQTENGKLKYPYFSQLREEMSYFVPIVLKDNPSMTTEQILQESYSRAVRANPKTFQSYQKELEAQRELENRQRVQKKKHAGSSISGAPDGGKPQVPMSLREELEARFAGRL